MEFYLGIFLLLLSIFILIFQDPQHNNYAAGLISIFAIFILLLTLFITSMKSKNVGKQTIDTLYYSKNFGMIFIIMFFFIFGYVFWIYKVPNVKFNRLYLLTKLICVSISTSVTIIITFFAIMKVSFPKEHLRFAFSSMGSRLFSISLASYIFSITFNLLDAVKIKNHKNISSEGTYITFDLTNKLSSYLSKEDHNKSINNRRI